MYCLLEFHLYGCLYLSSSAPASASAPPAPAPLPASQSIFLPLASIVCRRNVDYNVTVVRGSSGRNSQSLRRRRECLIKDLKRQASSLQLPEPEPGARGGCFMLTSGLYSEIRTKRVRFCQHLHSGPVAANGQGSGFGFQGVGSAILPRVLMLTRTMPVWCLLFVLIRQGLIRCSEETTDLKGVDGG